MTPRILTMSDVTLFRPCLDLHRGTVAQIVGGSLRDDDPDAVRTNFTSERGAAWYVERYRRDDQRGGHVIMLGPGNTEAARSALAAWPGGLQIGGGIHIDNAADWLEAGAAQVIVTSWLFPEARLDLGRARALAERIGRRRVIIDLSCRRIEDGWRVAANRWQTLTDTPVDAVSLEALGDCCAGFLVHAADVEGTRTGIDEELVRMLSDSSPRPVTYAGGARSLADLQRVEELSAGRVDLTIGSALDIFGGDGAAYADCVRWNRERL